jgi:membrane-bound serine protease (ClpP class)
MKKAFILLMLLFFTAPAQAEILKIRIDGIIDPITSEFIESTVREAEAQEAEFLLIELDTPGGLGVSMQEIIQTILNSRVPIVCYVTPSGARAASAGFFILLAADVAIMSPGTNTGAAHPVFPLGGDNEVMMQKVRNDALASLRSIVRVRDRNYEMAEQAVLESKSFTAQESLEGKLIDLVADNQASLLRQLHGFEVTRFTGEKQFVRTEDQAIREVQMTFRQRVLSTIATPNFALILGVLGLLGLYLEFTNPGLIFPGVLGAIALLLALLGFALLPVNVIGILLILLAIGLFIAEVTVQGFGVLGIGGVVAMTLGFLFLIDAPYPELRVDTGLAIAIAVGFGLIFMFLLHLAVKSYRSKVSTGEAGMIDMIGTARTNIDQEGGQVFVHGEWWHAVSDVPIATGSKIRVVRATNLSLVVEPVTRSVAERSDRDAKQT